MAALMRMSRLANAGGFRCLFQHKRLAYSTLTAVRISLIRNELKSVLPNNTFLRHVGAVSVTESLLQETSSDLPGAQTTRGLQNRYLNLETRITNLEGQIRRLSRVDRGQLYRILTQAENEDGLSDQQALALVRASGSLLVKETAARRQEIFKQMWDRLQKMGVKFTIAHHNAALKTRVENGEVINPEEVLMDIENNLQLFPNRITYQLLISVYCQKGDLTGATAILEHMKSQEIPINEAVFHALIMGHLRQEDVTGARDVVDTMRASGLLPNADTYTALLCGHAQRGDLEGFNAVLAETETEEVSLQSRHLFEAIVSAVSNGHSSLLDKMLKEVHDIYGNRAPFNQEALNCTFRLSALGKDQEALTVFRCITDIPVESYKETIALNLLDTLVIQGKPLEQLLQTHEELLTSGYLSGCQYRHLVTSAARNEDIGKALELLTKMEEMGEELGRQDFQPLLRSRSSQNPDVAYTIGSQMAAQVQEPAVAADIFFQLVEPLLKRRVDTEEIYTRLREHGMAEKCVGQLRVLNCMYTAEYSQAKDLVSVHGLPGLGGISLLLAQGFHKSKDVEGLIDFLQYLRMHVISSKFYDDMTATTLSRAIGRKEVDLVESEALIAVYNSKGFALRNKVAEEDVRRFLVVKDITPDRLEEIMKSFKTQSVAYVGEPKRTEVSRENLSSMQTQYEANPDALPPSLRNTTELLLLKAYCRDGNVEMADKVKARLDDRGFQYRLDLLITLGQYYAKKKKVPTATLR